MPVSDYIRSARAKEDDDLAGCSRSALLDALTLPPRDPARWAAYEEWIVCAAELRRRGRGDLIDQARAAARAEAFPPRRAGR